MGALGQGGPRWSRQVPAPGEAQQPGLLEGGGWACVGKAGAMCLDVCKRQVIFIISGLCGDVSGEQKENVMHTPRTHPPPVTRASWLLSDLNRKMYSFFTLPLSGEKSREAP